MSLVSEMRTSYFTFEKSIDSRKFFFSSFMQKIFFEKKIDFRKFGLDPEQKKDFDIFFHDHVKI